MRKAVVALVAAGTLLFAGAPAAQASSTFCFKAGMIKRCQTKTRHYIKECHTYYMGPSSVTKCKRYKRH
jgi:hypothetical protein